MCVYSSLVSWLIVWGGGGRRRVVIIGVEGVRVRYIRVGCGKRKPFSSPTISPSHFLLILHLKQYLLPNLFSKNIYLDKVD